MIGLSVLGASTAAVCVLIIVTGTVTSPPAPHDRFGPFTARFPTARAALSVVACVVAIVMWRRHVEVADTPVVATAAAHIGVSSIAGRVLATQPVLSWFAGEPCVAYRAEVTVRNAGAWKVAWSHGAAADLIQLVDGSGSVHVDGATLGELGPWRRGAHLDIGRRYRLDELVVDQGAQLALCSTCRLDADGALVARPEPVPGAPGAHLARVWFARLGTGLPRRRVHVIVAGCVAWLLVTSTALITTWTTQSVGEQQASRFVLRLDNPVRAVAVTGGTALAMVVVAAIVVGYNRLVSLREQVRYARSLIDVMMQRRRDLIPSLVAAAEAAAAHEAAALQEVATLRAAVAGGGFVSAAVEAAPELQADEAFMRVFQATASCERQISAAEKFHNDAATLVETRAATFPLALLRPFVFPGGIPPLVDV